MFGLAVLPACGGRSIEIGEETGTAEGGTGGSSGSAGVSGTSTAGSELIEIAWECAGTPGCVDEPLGVLSLRAHLTALTTEFLLKGSCADVF